MQEGEKYVKITFMERKMNLKKMIIGAVALVFVIMILLFVGIFRVKSVEVTGNSYYTEEEIKQLVMGESENSLYLFILYNYMDEKEIPFIDEVEVSLKGPDSIQIRVYEKTLIGYVNYMGSNLYFDKDGTVVESSEEVLPFVPKIEGLKVDKLSLYQRLSVENEEVFEILLAVSKMMKKYELQPDDIHLRKNGMEIVLTFANVRINLGNGANMDEKAARIKTLLPDLEDMAGVLHMEEYTNESTNISFIKDT